eukprot:4121815-Amphidinium_carterae.2
MSWHGEGAPSSRKGSVGEASQGGGLGFSTISEHVSPTEKRTRVCSSMIQTDTPVNSLVTRASRTEPTRKGGMCVDLIIRCALAYPKARAH